MLLMIPLIEILVVPVCKALVRYHLEYYRGSQDISDKHAKNTESNLVISQLITVADNKINYNVKYV